MKLLYFFKYRVATGITLCGCLILQADFWQHLVAKLIPPFASSQLCSPRPAFSALCCTMGVMGGLQHSWASSSVSQLLPESKTSSPGTAQALQKGSGESSQNFHSSLQPPVFLWALHPYIASGSVPMLLARRTEKKNTHQCLEFHWHLCQVTGCCWRVSSSITALGIWAATVICHFAWE